MTNKQKKAQLDKEYHAVKFKSISAKKNKKIKKNIKRKEKIDNPNYNMSAHLYLMFFFFFALHDKSLETRSKSLGCKCNSSN